MKVKVAKWGNSLGVRLPKAAVEQAGVKAGAELDLMVEGGGFRLQASAKTSAELLAEMVAEMKRLGPEKEPETVDWGPDRGSEIIEDAYSRGEITLDDILRRAGTAKKAKEPQRRKQHAPARSRRHRSG
jgi:antitoxin MazE